MTLDEDRATLPNLQTRTDALLKGVLLSNSWARSSNLEAYVHLGTYALDGKLHKAFVISNINAKIKGTGSFTSYLGRLEIMLRSSDIRYVYVESVLNKRLAFFLEARGYLKRDTGWTSAFSYYKFIAGGVPCAVGS